MPSSGIATATVLPAPENLVLAQSRLTMMQRIVRPRGLVLVVTSQRYPSASSTFPARTVAAMIRTASSRYGSSAYGPSWDVWATEPFHSLSWPTESVDDATRLTSWWKYAQDGVDAADAGLPQTDLPWYRVGTLTIPLDGRLLLTRVMMQQAITDQTEDELERSLRVVEWALGTILDGVTPEADYIVRWYSA